MSFEFEIPEWGWHAATWLLLVVAPTAYAGYLLWPLSAQRREKQVFRWAQENLVTLSPSIGRAAEQALQWRSRLSGLLVLTVVFSIGLAAVGPLPAEPSIPPWSVAVALGAAFTLAQGWHARREWFTPGAARSARPRSVSLSDYVPQKLRLIAWVATASCLVSLGLSFAQQPAARILSQAAPAIAVLIALLAAEWSGRRMASGPQPASDATELYAQDAWRAEVASRGFVGAATWGCMATATLPELGPGWPITVRLIGVGLMAVVFIVGLNEPRPMAWTRMRLWPKLAPGEYVEYGVRAS